MPPNESPTLDRGATLSRKPRDEAEDEPADAAFAEADRAMALAEGREKVCLGSGALPYEAIPETKLKLPETE